MQQSTCRLQLLKLTWDLCWLQSLLAFCSFDGKYIEASESADWRLIRGTKKTQTLLIYLALVRSSYICGLKADKASTSVIPAVCCPQEASVSVTSASFENVTQNSDPHSDKSEGESLTFDKVRKHLSHPDACGISLVHDRDGLPEAGEARLGQHPWVAVLTHNESEAQSCSGTIIGPRV